MPPVLFFNAPRDCYRDTLVSGDELYITRAPVGERTRCIQRPPGVYDVTAMLKDLSEPYREPTLVMCQWDCENVCRPTNLAGVKCPKVLLVGDTHHTHRPLTRAIQQALAEPWDLVVLEFNPQHVHWFTEVGVKNVVYIPCFTISPYDIPPPAKRTRGVTFVGNVGPDHHYRRYVLAELKRRGVDVEVISGVTREQAARIYNESVASLNIPLNGDWNLRNEEIVAAGGYKVLFDRNLDKYASNISWALREPDSALSQASIDRWGYFKSGGPSAKIYALSDALARRPRPAPIICPHVWDRINIYEQVQELVCQGRWHKSDFADLPDWSLP